MAEINEEVKVDELDIEGLALDKIKEFKTKESFYDYCEAENFTEEQSAAALAMWAGANAKVVEGTRKRRASGVVFIDVVYDKKTYPTVSLIDLKPSLLPRKYQKKFTEIQERLTATKGKSLSDEQTAGILIETTTVLYDQLLTEKELEEFDELTIVEVVALLLATTADSIKKNGENEDEGDPQKK